MTVEPHPSPYALTPEEAVYRAAQYRQRAETAAAADTCNALLRQAERYERLAGRAVIEFY